MINNFFSGDRPLPLQSPLFPSFPPPSGDARTSSDRTQSSYTTQHRAILTVFLLSRPPDSQRSSDDVFWREFGAVTAYTEAIKGAGSWYVETIDRGNWLATSRPRVVVWRRPCCTAVFCRAFSLAADNIAPTTTSSSSSSPSLSRMCSPFFSSAWCQFQRLVSATFLRAARCRKDGAHLATVIRCFAAFDVDFNGILLCLADTL